MGGSAKYGALEINQGTVRGCEINDIHQYPSTVVLNGGTLIDPDNVYSYSTNKTNIEVPEGKSATWQLDSRCGYKGKLTGAGTLNITVTSVRCQMQGDWSAFAGKLIFGKKKTGSYEPAIMWDNSYGLPNATVAGIFDNNGKNTNIGTITGSTETAPTGSTTLSGNGSYTVEHITARITKSRSGMKNSYIEVSGALSLTGDVTVIFSGTSKLTNGNTIQLWKSNSFQSSPNINITLPELPEGLYWDTSELLTKDGTLKVTNVPTGINNVISDIDEGQNIWYTIDGRRIDGAPSNKGIYIKNGKKIVIK